MQYTQIQHDVEMAAKMAAKTYLWSKLCNYQLKFDEFGVYTQVSGGKAHIIIIRQSVS